MPMTTLIRVYVMQLVDVSKCHPSFLSLIIRGYKGQLYTDLEVRRQPLPWLTEGRGKTDDIRSGNYSQSSYRRSAWASVCALSCRCGTYQLQGSWAGYPSSVSGPYRRALAQATQSHWRERQTAQMLCPRTRLSMVAHACEATFYVLGVIKIITDHLSLCW